MFQSILNVIKCTLLVSLTSIMMVSRITTLIQVFLTLSCMIHVGYIVYYIFNPELPEIRVYKKHLKDINQSINHDEDSKNFDV